MKFLASNDAHSTQIRKRLWLIILSLAMTSFAYNLYQDSQTINRFSAKGLLIKVVRDNSAPYIEVFDDRGHLKRLQHKHLVIPSAIKAGDAFVKEVNSEQALIAGKVYRLSAQSWFE